jgi:hypothetical protein
MADQTIVAPAPNTTPTTAPPVPAPPHPTPPPPGPAPVIDSAVHKTKPAGRQPKPVRELPVVPVATNAAGVLEVLGSAVYQATGMTGLVVAGSVIGGAATLAGVKKARAAGRSRKARRSSGLAGAATGRGGPSRGLRSGRGAGATSGGRGGAHRASSRMPNLGRLLPGTTGRGSGTAGRTSARPAGRTPSTAGRLTAPATSRIAKAAQAAKRRASATPLGRSLRNARSGAKRVGRSALSGASKTSNPLRAATRAFRAAMQPTPGGRHRTRTRRVAAAATAATAAAGWVTVRAAMRQLARLARTVRRFVASRWHRFHNAPEQAGGAVPVPELPVGTKVRRPDGTAPAPHYISNPTAGGPTMSEATISAAMRALLDHVDQMVKIAAQYDEDDMLVYGADLNALPDLIDGLRQVFARFAAQSSSEFPIHPAVVATQDAIPTALASVSMVASHVGPAYQSIHRDQLDRLRSRGHAREDKWNVPTHRGGK